MLSGPGERPKILRPGMRRAGGRVRWRINVVRRVRMRMRIVSVRVHVVGERMVVKDRESDRDNAMVRFG